MTWEKEWADSRYVTIKNGNVLSLDHNSIDAFQVWHRLIVQQWQESGDKVY